MTAALSDRDLLAKLVAFDSTSCNSNLPIADFICDYVETCARGRDLQVHRNPNPEGTKANIVLRLPGRRDVCGSSAGGASDGRTSDGRTSHGRTSADRASDGVSSPPTGRGLILSAHLDTVPANEPDWESDPFTLRETADAFFGRGACDMKGFVALAVNALVRSKDWALDDPLVLLLTFDEEPGILGAKYFVETWKGALDLPRSVIVGEPTRLQVVRMHKGHLKLRVIVTGRSAHSGYPHLGINAIEPFGDILCALTEVRRAFGLQRVPSSEFYPETPFPSLSVTQIHGGVASNVIPDRCELVLGIRVLPGMAEERLAESVRAAVAQSAGKSHCEVEVVNDSPALFTPDDAPIYRAVRELMGQKETHAVSYATDGGPLQQLGLQCVIWGPGNIAVAHKPNEWMPKDEFRRGGELLERLVRSWCGGRK